MQTERQIAATSTRTSFSSSRYVFIRNALTSEELCVALDQRSLTKIPRTCRLAVSKWKLVCAIARALRRQDGKQKTVWEHVELFANVPSSDALQPGTHAQVSGAAGVSWESYGFIRRPELIVEGKNHRAEADAFRPSGAGGGPLLGLEDDEQNDPAEDESRFVELDREAQRRRQSLSSTCSTSVPSYGELGDLSRENSCQPVSDDFTPVPLPSDVLVPIDLLGGVDNERGYAEPETTCGASSNSNSKPENGTTNPNEVRVVSTPEAGTRVEASYLIPGPRAAFESKEELQEALRDYFFISKGRTAYSGRVILRKWREAKQGARRTFLRARASGHSLAEARELQQPSSGDTTSTASDGINGTSHHVEHLLYLTAAQHHQKLQAEDPPITLSELEGAYGPVRAWDVSLVKDLSGLFGTLISSCDTLREEEMRERRLNNVVGDLRIVSVFAPESLPDMNVSLWNVEGVENLSAMFQGYVQFTGCCTQGSRWDELLGDDEDVDDFCGDGVTKEGPSPRWWSTTSDANYVRVRPRTSDRDRGTTSMRKSDINEVASLADLRALSSARNRWQRAKDCVNKWDVSAAKDISYMFAGCKNFNGHLSKWSVKSVRSFEGMLENCHSFNNGTHIDLENEYHVNADREAHARRMNALYGRPMQHVGGPPGGATASGLLVVSGENNENANEGTNEAADPDSGDEACHRVVVRLEDGEMATFLKRTYHGKKMYFGMASAAPKCARTSDEAGADKQATSTGPRHEERCLRNRARRATLSLTRRHDLARALDWDLRSAENLRRMFKDCARFDQNVRLRNTASVRDMDEMFSGCRKWNPRRFVTGVLRGEVNVHALEAAEADMQNVDSCSSSLSSIRSSGSSGRRPARDSGPPALRIFDSTTSVVRMARVFADCRALDPTPFPLFLGDSLANCVTLSGAFRGCSALRSQLLLEDPTSTKNCADFSALFAGCVQLNPPNDRILTSDAPFDVTNAKDLRLMFRNCAKLTAPISFVGLNIRDARFFGYWFGDMFRDPEDPHGAGKPIVDELFGGCESLDQPLLEKYWSVEARAAPEAFAAALIVRKDSRDEADEDEASGAGGSSPSCSGETFDRKPMRCLRKEVRENILKIQSIFNGCPKMVARYPTLLGEHVAPIV